MRHTVYRSADGEAFDTMDECREHEKAAAIELIANCHSGHVHEAIHGDNEQLAIAIKKIANLIPLRLRAPRKEKAEAAE
jgi:hypothetical protein